MRYSFLLLATLFACSSGSSSPAANPDSGSSSDGQSEGPPPIQCPPPGPPVASISVDAYGSEPAFQIDATEVTQSAYCAFLASSPDPSRQPSFCAWNKTFYPSGGASCGRFDPMPHPNFPVGCVDWCDALAYCAAAGKHLCGARGGGPIDPFALGSGMAGTDTVVNLAEYDEWFAACSHDNDGRIYSFGSSLGPTTCNGPASGSGGPIDVGSNATCVGGFPGLFDMSGNVWEWENACAGDDSDGGADAGPPTMSPCRARGGAYDGNNVDLECRLTQSDTLLSFARSETHPEVGFRCCL